jgi:tRNA pseudouridine55 synthase
MSAQSRNQIRPSGSAHGVLVIDKPKGMTSHDVVSRVRRAFGTRRVGHAGTLDPMATGVLVLLLGEATKLSSVLTRAEKTYEARVTFGTSTSSGDADGVVVKTVPLEDDWLKAEQLEIALESERKRRLQIPPQVSAVKVAGKRAYAIARKGEPVDLAPRDVAVHELFLKNRSGSHLDLFLRVSKGYYVRSLAVDLGSHLEVPAHLSELRRTKSGAFDLSTACSLPLDGSEPLLPIQDAARLCLPSLSVNDEGALRLRQGKHLRLSDLTNVAPPDEDWEVYAAFQGEHLVALVQPCEHEEFRVKRGFSPAAGDSSRLPADVDHG